MPTKPKWDVTVGDQVYYIGRGSKGNVVYTLSEMRGNRQQFSYITDGTRTFTVDTADLRRAP